LSIIWPEGIQPENLRFSNWYDQLISNAKSRFIPKGTYVENHHIVPRSFGGDGSKNNIVQLYAREHYIAHLLLWKMRFPGLYHTKMAFAFNTFMNRMQKNNPLIPDSAHNYKINNKLYEQFRIEYSKLLKEKIAQEGATFKGRTHTEEAKRIIGEKSKLKEFKRGPEHHSYGKKMNLPPEVIAKRAEAIKNFWEDPEKKQALLERRKQASMRPEVVARRKQLADSRRGVKRDPAIMEKCAASKRGKKWEEIYSPETIEKMHEARRNRVISPEGKERQREATRKLGQRPKSAAWREKMSQRMKGIQRQRYKCRHCGIETVLSNINRYHNDKCKKKDIVCD